MSRFFICFLLLAAIQPVHAQNSYPATGDAQINSLTIGRGSSFLTDNTVLGKVVALSGEYCVAVGDQALTNNTIGYGNTAVGWSSLLQNTTGNYNVAFGRTTLYSNVTGGHNVAFNGLYANVSGNSNTGLGYQTLSNNTTGDASVALGVAALFWNTSASNLVAVGDSALFNNTASYNTAIGSKALLSATTGGYNTALGYQTLYTNTSGYFNTASGYQTLYSNQTGSYNTAYGGYTLYSNTGYSNTATGTYTLSSNTTGSYNTAGGLEAMLYNTTGSYNTGIGTSAGPSSGNLSNTTSLGYSALATVSNSVAIGNSSVTSIGGYASWTNFSDGRFKKNINHNVPGLAFINKLAPITYTLDIDGIEATSTRSSDNPAIKQAMKEKAAVVYTGFVAQDVERAARSIGYDFSGIDKPKNAQQSFYGLRYSDFVVPLVMAVQELSRQNDSLENAIAQSNAQLAQRLDQAERLLGLKTATGPNGQTLNLRKNQ